MPEYLYCVLSPHWDDCKMGMWNGSYHDLWARYATVLGADIIQVVVFECEGRRCLEHMLLGFVRKYHVCGEVFNREAFPWFLKFCNKMCKDVVVMPQPEHTNAISKMQANKRRSAKRKRQTDQLHMQRELETAKPVQIDAFLAEECTVCSDGNVNAGMFRARLADMGCIISQQELKLELAKRGFVCKQVWQGYSKKNEKMYTGLQWRTLAWKNPSILDLSWRVSIHWYKDNAAARCPRCQFPLMKKTELYYTIWSLHKPW